MSYIIPSQITENSFIINKDSVTITSETETLTLNKNNGIDYTNQELKFHSQLECDTVGNFCGVDFDFTSRLTINSENFSMKFLKYDNETKTSTFTVTINGVEYLLKVTTTTEYKTDDYLFYSYNKEDNNNEKTGNEWFYHNNTYEVYQNDVLVFKSTSLIKNLESGQDSYFVSQTNKLILSTTPFFAVDKKHSTTSLIIYYQDLTIKFELNDNDNLILIKNGSKLEFFDDMIWYTNPQYKRIFNICSNVVFDKEHSFYFKNEGFILTNCLKYDNKTKTFSKAGKYY